MSRGTVWCLKENACTRSVKQARIALPELAVPSEVLGLNSAEGQSFDPHDIGMIHMDMVIVAMFFMVMFFSYMMVFEGTPDLIEAKIRQDVFTAVKGSWMTWIPAHTINFAFVPSDMRLLYINTIQIFFNMFMSVIGNTEAVAAE